jgi:predicted DNA-binding transcriptional regulator YafY
LAQTDRLYKLKHWLDAGRCLTRGFLLAELEVSPATLKRDLALLRNRMNAPIAWDRDRRGWWLDRSQPSVGTHQGAQAGGGASFVWRLRGGH